jgi:hypothetical protein
VRKPALRWSREPRERGLRAIVQAGNGGRGWNLRFAGEKLGEVRPVGQSGWRWWASVGGSSADRGRASPCATLKQAQAECAAWVREQLVVEAEQEEKERRLKQLFGPWPPEANPSGQKEL